jgi:hypothetical protein
MDVSKNISSLLGPQEVEIGVGGGSGRNTTTYYRAELCKTIVNIISLSSAQPLAMKQQQH